MDDELQQDDAASRLRLVLGEKNVARLEGSRVMVLGLGGVGGACAEALARSRVGSLVLVDRDVVGASNINRQVIAFNSTVGRAKTDVMRDMALDINPDCDITTLHAYVAKDTLEEQLDALPAPDFVVDAIDTVTQKLLVAQWAQARGYRLVSSMGAANKLYPELLRFSRIEKTEGDRLCRIMRKECRRRGIKGLTVLYSPEPTMPVHTDVDASEVRGDPEAKGAVLGTMSYMPAIMGQMIASYVICELLGLQNEHLGRSPR